MVRFVIDYPTDRYHDPENDCMYSPRVTEFGNAEVNAGINGRDEVLVRDHEIELLIDYPFMDNRQLRSTHTSDNGFTGLDLFRIICEAYEGLYVRAETNAELYRALSHDRRWLWIEGIEYDPETHVVTPVIGT